MKVAAALAVLLIGGCYDPITEVVLVVPSDLTFVSQTPTGAFIWLGAGDQPPPTTGGGSFFRAFPLTVGVHSIGASKTFSARITIKLNDSPGLMETVVERAVTGIRFVPHETRMLVVPMLEACACHEVVPGIPGHDPCPDAATPNCDLVAPATIPFDPTLVDDNAALLALGGAGASDASVDH